MIINEEKEKLFKKVRTMMGAPIHKTELTNDQLCELFENVINDYSETTQNWLIEAQWMNLFGKNITEMDLTFALSTQSLDYEKQFSYAYSKQVGLQNSGPYELKKDFFMLEDGKQVYEIPAGREINRVLWQTPPAIQAALMANYGGVAGADLGYAQNGSTGGMFGSGGVYGMGGYYIAPAYDVLATSMDFNLKNNILRSDLIYKVTAGPNGTRLIHLMNTPGRTNFTQRGFFSQFGMTGCAVWYHYYDINPGNVDECRKLNPDVLLTPDQVPLEELDYFHFNTATKNIIRKLLVAEAKMLLARIRGKFSGVIKIADAEQILDYKMLEEQGKSEREEVMKELKDRLERMSPWKMLERAAKQAEDLNKALRFQPHGWFIA